MVQDKEIRSYKKLLHNLFQLIFLPTTAKRKSLSHGDSDGYELTSDNEIQRLASGATPQGSNEIQLVE